MKPLTNSVSLEAMEVIQSIQDMAQSVPILEGRRTMVRVYLSVASVTGTSILQGKITVTPKDGSPPVVVDSMRPAFLEEKWNGAWKTFKRKHLRASLNFELPKSLMVVGNYSIELTEVRDRVSGNPVACGNCAGMGHQYEVVPTVPLRLRVVGLTYQDGTTFHSPRPVDYRSIRSWLKRAYPVNDVLMMKGSIPWTGAVPFDAAAANAFVAQVRVLEVGSGVDGRTHYYGLVHDGGFYFDGSGTRPATPDPAAVASGPAGVSLPIRHSWDEDGSYADTYAGHELGHTLGQRHISGTCGESGVNIEYPHSFGKLSDHDPDLAFVGLDFGNPRLGISRTTLDGSLWHDAMSYCPYRWVSAYTYCRIRDQLLAENKLFEEAEIAVAAAAERRNVEQPARAALLTGVEMNVVVGIVDLAKMEGKITSINVVNQASPVHGGGRIKCVARTDTGQVLEKVAAEYEQPDGKSLIMCVFPSAGVVRIDLMAGNTVLDTRQASANGPQFVQPVRGVYVQRRLTSVQWEANDADGDQVRYAVQILNGNSPCETVLLDSPETSLELSGVQIPRMQNEITVRVLATDGFRTSETKDTIALMAPDD